jgi:hypothetical protein
MVVDLVVAVQATANSGAVIDKLGGSGILFSQLLAAAAGETAVISFSDEVKVHQDFTNNPGGVIHPRCHASSASPAGTPSGGPPPHRPHDCRAARIVPVKTQTVEDLKPEDERIKVQKCALCPAPDTTPAPLDVGPGVSLYGIQELMCLRKPDLSHLFTKTTGGLELAFILSFQPQAGDPGTFHRIRVDVRNRSSSNSGCCIVRPIRHNSHA